MYTIRGRCHPPPQKNTRTGNKRGWAIDDDETETTFPQYKGLPVYDEHLSNKYVGRVHKIWKEKPSGAIVVDIKTDDTAYVERVVKGELGELSINFSAKSDGVYRTSKPIPKEISICKIGAMDDAKIFAIVMESPTGEKTVMTVPKLSRYTPPPSSVHKSNEKMSTAETTPKEKDVEVQNSEGDSAGLENRLNEEQKKEAYKDYVFKKQKQIEKITNLVQGDILNGWKSAVQSNLIEFDPNFGCAVEKIAQDESSHCVLECMASYISNYQKLQNGVVAHEAKQAEAQAKSQVLQTRDERKIPLSFPKISTLFVKPETEVEVANSAVPVPENKKRSLAELFNLDDFETKRAHVHSQMSADIRRSV